MSPRIVRKWLVSVGLVGGAALVLSGCPEDAAEITEQAVPPSQNFPIASNYIAAATSVTVDQLVLASFDTTVTDAFDRETGEENFSFNPAGQWNFGLPFVSGDDPRLPAPTAAMSFSGAGIRLNDPQQQGPGFYFWFISGAMADLPPSTQFTVAFVLFGQEVRGELDQAATLLGDPITQPDSLVLINPNPLGDPAVVLGVGPATTNFGDTINVIAGANPWILGNASSDATGASDFGIVFTCGDAGGTPIIYCSDTPTATALADSAVHGRNDGQGYGLPRYNYVVMYDCVCVPDATTPIIARWQAGEDRNDSDDQP